MFCVQSDEFAVSHANREYVPGRVGRGGILGADSVLI